MDTEVRLGMPVVTSDGKRIGKVDSLVVDPDRQEFLEMIVHKGLFPGVDRIIDKVYIDRLDPDENVVVLKIDAETAETLPPYVAHEYSVALTQDAGSVPYAMGAGPTTNTAILWRQQSPVRHGMGHASAALYQTMVAEGGVVEARSNLPEQAVTLDRGTDVIDVDGTKIGVVEQVHYDERGHITSFVVLSGFIHREDMTIPIEDVASIAHRAVRLKVDVK